MSGKPQRDRPKRSVQVTVDADVKRRLNPLLEDRGCGSMSLSRLIESLLFLVESAYMEEPEEELLRRGYQVQASRLLHIARQGHEPVRVLVHLTLDEDVCDFMDVLKHAYPMLVGSRSDIVTLATFRAAQLCSDGDRLAYLARRLAQVQRNHPTRR